MDQAEKLRNVIKLKNQKLPPESKSNYGYQWKRRRGKIQRYS